MYGKTRFSSFAILIESLQRHHKIFERAVKSPAYMLAARKALKRDVWIPTLECKHHASVLLLTEDDRGALLKAAKEAMMDDRSPYNTRLIPLELTGLQKYSVIYQDVISQMF
jgi:hypothetical protein